MLTSESMKKLEEEFRGHCHCVFVRSTNIANCPQGSEIKAFLPANCVFPYLIFPFLILPLPSFCSYLVLDCFTVSH